MTRAAKLAAGLAVTLLLFGGVELALRLTVPEQALRFSWEAEDPLLVLEGDELNLAPGRREQLHDGRHPWTLETNSLGLRESRDIPREAPAGELRVLALGDSWMFGHNATQGETLPDQLERLLPERLGVGSAEVINGAVFGSCAFDMLRRWTQLSALYPLDAVLLGRPHNETRQAAISDRRERWFSQVRQAPWIDLYLYLGLRRLLAPYTRPQYPYLQGEQASSGLPDLVALSRDAIDRGLEVWFVGWPTDRRQPMEDRFEDLAPWAEALEPLGVRLTGHVLPQRACWGYEDPHHPSEAGYRAIAEVVADIMAGGPHGQMRESPSCLEVPGDGPGK
ncbi:MAG: SGNH/GDSL hydrolase family protein [Alphaproteobacteria bacterium]|nr:SGNH/GDSL hydrolase family protein [Alphaproteobacteria bacterium]